MRLSTGQQIQPGRVFVCRDSVKCGVWTVGSVLMEFYARLSRMPASQYGSSLEIKIECTPRGCEREGSETGVCEMGQGTQAILHIHSAGK